MIPNFCISNTVVPGLTNKSKAIHEFPIGMQLPSESNFDIRYFDQKLEKQVHNINWKTYTTCTFAIRLILQSKYIDRFGGILCSKFLKTSRIKEKSVEAPKRRSFYKNVNEHCIGKENSNLFFYNIKNLITICYRLHVYLI